MVGEKKGFAYSPTSHMYAMSACTHVGLLKIGTENHTVNNQHMTEKLHAMVITSRDQKQE